MYARTVLRMLHPLAKRLITRTRQSHQRLQIGGRHENAGRLHSRTDRASGDLRACRRSRVVAEQRVGNASRLGIILWNESPRRFARETIGQAQQSNRPEGCGRTRRRQENLRRQLRGLPWRRETGEFVRLRLLPARAAILPGRRRRGSERSLCRDPRWHSLFGNAGVEERAQRRANLASSELRRDHSSCERQADGHGPRLTSEKRGRPAPSPALASVFVKQKFNTLHQTSFFTCA